MEEKIAFKKKVIDELLRLKTEQLEALKKEQKSRLESANEEDIDKGDLVESPKEQMMDEIDLQAGSMDQLSDEVAQLKTIDPNEVHHTVAFGSLVKTNVGYFMIGAAHPITEIDGEKVIGLSIQAPLYLKMEGLRKQSEFHLGNIEYVILDII